MKNNINMETFQQTLSVNYQGTPSEYNLLTWPFICQIICWCTGLIIKGLNGNVPVSLKHALMFWDVMAYFQAGINTSKSPS